MPGRTAGSAVSAASARTLAQLYRRFGEVDAAETSPLYERVAVALSESDEAPDAYKRLDAVLAAHGDTIEIVHRLAPIGVAMAGADTFDPYKD